MSSAKVNRFEKTRDCLPSQQLLSLSLAGSTNESSSEVFSHLEVCDFCGAEAHFLSKFPVSLTPYVPVEMPPHLRLLAEALLCKQDGRVWN